LVEGRQATKRSTGRDRGAQGQDRVWALGKLLWSADLILFGLAAVGRLLAAVSGSLGWVLTALALMVGTFFFGRWFAVKVPHTHLADVRVLLAHVKSCSW
jgi:hypothetical protein